MAGQRKTLRAWEVAIIKTMLARDFTPQDIQAYFSRPSRTVNHARVLEIRDEKRHKTVEPASKEVLDTFLRWWPFVDPDTGLQLQDDELVIKAREAMIAAVHVFNSGGLHFRSELFIVTAIIAWTYLLHAYYEREGVDHRYYEKDGVTLKKTRHGSDKFWELGTCVSHEKCPLDDSVVKNLEFLFEIRHEIEHRYTSRIDETISAELQACCLNFNDAIKELFGAQLALERRLSVALQFATFNDAQGESIAGADVPPSIAATIADFEKELDAEQLADQRFRYRVALLPTATKHATKAHEVVTVAKAGTPEAEGATTVVVRPVEKPKYRTTDVVKKAREAGYTYNRRDHDIMVRQFDAKNEGKGYSYFLTPQWWYYDTWVEKVLAELDGGWTRPARQ